MSDTYKTITSKIGQGTYTEKRSKFLSFCHHVSSQEQVKELLTTYRKKYYDARHICYAYVLGAERLIFRANDDGEPGSTAGKPILGQINKYELTDILVIVVRYYGGINLGTGGLMTAYRTAAEAGIENSEKVEEIVEETTERLFPYERINDVMRVVKEMSSRVISLEYGESCRIILSVRKSKIKELRHRLDKVLIKANP